MDNNNKGLTSQEVQERIACGKVNGQQNLPTKSVGQIIRTNTFTLFNGINLILAVLILTMSRGTKWNDVLFMGIVFFNLFVGIYQEIRAKLTIEKLSLISAPKVSVVRDGEDSVIAVAELVIDDVMKLEVGRQICADSVVLDGAIEVNEAMITGESEPVTKCAGEELLSGSFVVSGCCKAQVIHIGADNYAAKIASGARYIKQPNSQILKGLRAIIRLMSMVVLPLGIGLFLKQYFVSGNSISDAVLKMAGSIVSMIPQGLVALSATVFAVGVIRLSRYKTLSQDLYSIETLARVDVLCLDKTGTITEGSMVVTDIVPMEGCTKESLCEIMSSLSKNLNDNNPTNAAVKAYCKESVSGDVAAKIFPFSSARKWSGISVSGKGSYIMGAVEFIKDGWSGKYGEVLSDYSAQGKRVIAVAYSEAEMTDMNIPEDVQLGGFILIEDKIRDEAPATLAYFAEQGVDIRIISGDNPITVSAIAAKAGLDGADRYTDASSWDTNIDLKDMAAGYKIFGRVTPEQKLALIKMFKAEGHTVAMTGDGVNDVLALKEADCSVAMASGSDAARSVSQLVLLDSNFASMPKIVAEGRRSINNLQRSSSLFLVKTIYAALLAVIFLFIGNYPFEPSHLTLVGAVTIGLPSFLLALEPNKERAEGRFIHNALKKALPGAVTIVISIVLIQVISNFVEFTPQELDMLSILMVAASSFTVLFRVCLPMDIKHAVIFFSMLALYFFSWWLLPGVFNMVAIGDITLKMIIVLIPLIIINIPLLLLLIFLEKKLFEGKSSKLLKKLNLE